MVGVGMVASIIGLEPSLGHLNGSLPFLKSLLTLFRGYFRLEDGMIRAIDLGQLVKFFPDANGKTCRNG